MSGRRRVGAGLSAGACWIMVLTACTNGNARPAEQPPRPVSGLRSGVPPAVNGGEDVEARASSQVLRDSTRKGGCSAGQLHLSRASSGTGTGTYSDDEAFLYERVHNVGKGCWLPISKTFYVKGVSGAKRTVPVRAVGRNRYRLPANSRWKVTIGASWPDPAISPSGPCGHPVRLPTMVSLPIDRGMLRLHVPQVHQRDFGGAFRGVWREVCSAPRRLAPSLAVERLRS